MLPAVAVLLLLLCQLHASAALQVVWTPSTDFAHETGYDLGGYWRVDASTGTPGALIGSGPGGAAASGYSGAAAGESLCAAFDLAIDSISVDAFPMLLLVAEEVDSGQRLAQRNIIRTEFSWPGATNTFWMCFRPLSSSPVIRLKLLCVRGAACAPSPPRLCARCPR